VIALRCIPAESYDAPLFMDAPFDLKPRERKPRRGDVLDVELTHLDARGCVVGRSEEYTVRLRRGAPGARVRAAVVSRRRDRVEARWLETLRASDASAEPVCAHFGTCGGCSFQDVAYAAQLEEKRELVQRALRAAGLGSDATPSIAPCVPCDVPWHYRNKMDFTFGTRAWLESADDAPESRLALGLHPLGYHSKVLEVRACAIAFEGADRILASARTLARAHGLDAWDQQLRTGLLRHLVLRRSAASGEVLAYLITTEEAGERVAPYARALIAEHPEIATFVQGVNARPSLVAVGERDLLLHGSGVLRERLQGLEFTLSAGAFFQTNTAQAEKLAAIVRAQAACKPDDVVIDLYCGTGVWTLILAREAREAWGFELVESAVRDARSNAQRNAIASAHFVAGDVASSLFEAATRPPPDVLCVDPPRAGVHPRVLEALCTSTARRLVYVSCNPAVAAREAVLLVRAGWRLEAVQPVDLFPHTPHLECVFTFERAARA
jgi:23S rRNA (uracil1939-C5)-methyltransferase